MAGKRRNFYARRITGDFMQNTVTCVPTVPDNADCKDPWDDFLKKNEQHSAGAGHPALEKIRPERR